jgi:hypothetical protein
MSQRSSIPELGEDARAVINSGRAALVPTPLQRRRLRRSLYARLAAGTAAVAVVGLSTWGAYAKLGLAVVALVSAVAGASLWLSSPNARSGEAPPATGRERSFLLDRGAPAQEDAEPAAAFTRPPEASVDVGPAPEQAKSHSVEPLRPAARAPRSSHETNPLEEEVRLLSAARKALGKGSPAQALTYLQTYDRVVRAGVLAEERAVTGILVSCALGSVDQARQQARRFRARFPGSALASRVDRSCAGFDDQ